MDQMLVSAYYLQALLVITRVEVTGGPEGAASREQVPPAKHPPNVAPPGGQSTSGITSSETKVHFFLFNSVSLILIIFMQVEKHL